MDSASAIDEECIVCDSSDESVSQTPDDSSSRNDQSDDQSNLHIGILSEAFDILKTTSETCAKNGLATTCGLLIGGIKLIQKYEIYQDKIFGFTEGTGKNSRPEPKRMASKAIIFMVISLVENWKIPIGLFFVDNPDVKYFADIIEETLDRLNNVGVDIVSLTMNCVSPHFSLALAEELGVEIDANQDPSTFKTYFQHPSKKHATVYVLYDVEIILAHLKKYWVKNDLIFDNDKPIKHSICVKAKKLENTSVDSNCETIDYNWVICKKKLCYDPDILGKPYADALTYLKNLGHPDFQDTGPTIQFIRVLYFISQFSEVNGQKGQIWLNISQANEDQWRPVVIKTIEYFKNIQSSNQNPSEHLSIFKMYIVGILVYFMSVYEMYSTRNDYSHKTLSDKYRLPSIILPSRFALKNIRIGILQKSQQTKRVELSALGVYQKIKLATENLHPIDVDNI